MISRREFLASTAVLAAAPLSAAANTPPEFELSDELRPRYVRINKDLPAGMIIVVPQTHFLYLVTEPEKGIRYGVGVGRAGLEFQGRAIIERKAKWPSWRPTDSMIERDPKRYARFADGVPGGPNNPLGARALYMYENGIDTYYRIHGTTDPTSIGRSVSNGCIRMINEHVADLYERVPLGTEVVVL